MDKGTQGSFSGLSRFGGGHIQDSPPPPQNAEQHGQPPKTPPPAVEAASRPPERVTLHLPWIVPAAAWVMFIAGLLFILFLAFGGSTPIKVKISQ